ncbi:MAG: prepilin-type N-terminal cleavage/methylation domain-containing protein [Pseudomonadota bacterium]
MMYSKSQREQSIERYKGFTLLETLVALSVLAISLGVTYQVFSSALRGSNIADDYTQASMYADSHLAEISKRIDRLSGVSQGVYNQRYRWKLEVLPLDSGNSTAVLESVKRYQVVLDVYWQGKKGPRSIRATTFRLGRA